MSFGTVTKPSIKSIYNDHDPNVIAFISQYIPFDTTTGQFKSTRDISTLTSWAHTMFTGDKIYLGDYYDLLKPTISATRDHAAKILLYHYQDITSIIMIIIMNMNITPNMSIKSRIWLSEDKYIYNGILTSKVKYDLIMTWCSVLMGTMGHACLLLFYPRYKTVIFINPHGKAGGERSYARGDLCKLIFQRFLIAQGYKVNHVETLPHEGVQLFERTTAGPTRFDKMLDPEGYCSMWVILLVHLFIIKPNEDILNLVNSIMPIVISRKETLRSSSVFMRDYFINWTKVVYQVCQLGLMLNCTTLAEMIYKYPQQLFNCAADASCYDDLKVKFAAGDNIALKRTYTIGAPPGFEVPSVDKSSSLATERVKFPKIV
jgi:hypothetical protein